MTVVALVLRIYQLTRPGFLYGVTEYDDGVYFGSALRLVHGALPYRDFVLVHPPGITLLLTPAALLSKAIGTAKGFAVARVATALAGAAAVPLAGLIVRRRGALATVLTCGLLAVFPAGINAAHTVLLEPWLVLFCLLGVLAAFEGDEVSRRRARLGWAGAALGFATALKLWAVLPGLALLIVVLAARRRGWIPFLVGGLVAFCLAVLPFAALSPRAFYRGVIIAQLSRVDATRVPGVDRLRSLSGIDFLTSPSTGLAIAAALVLALIVVGGQIAAARHQRTFPPALESFALGSVVLVLAAFLWPADYYMHYAWFFAAFLALALGLSASRAMPAHPGGAAAVLGAAAAAAVLVVGAVQLHQLARLRAGDPAPVAHRRIAAGACVLTDNPALTIVSDRFVAKTPGCSAIVDGIGTDYALSHGRNGVTGAGRTAALRALWLSAFEHARYVWISCPPHAFPGCKTDRRIPWTHSILSYFRHHFRPDRGPGSLLNLFVRRA